MKEIELTQGKVALVDDEDYDKVNEYSWCAHKSSRDTTWYARGTINGRNTSMHRFILDLPPYKPMVDHINNNGLDNQKHNLRTVTNGQNQANKKSFNGTSKYKGVSKDSSKTLKNKIWRAQITSKGKCYKLGRFYSEIEAAKAYDKAALKYHGKYAKTNKDLGLL